MNTKQTLPQGFTRLEDPRIQVVIDYATSDNFLGRPVTGYLAPVCILTEPAAAALIRVQNTLDSLEQNFHLKIFDTYRPTSAVSDFIDWAKQPEEPKAKARYFPNLDKSTLFDLGYIGTRSTHSRGSTVDLTITVQSETDPTTFVDLEMGTIFDFFDERSNTNATAISATAKKNRILLNTVMHQQAFINFPMEWWHFTLENEPFPETYFNFPVA